jgi:hypothetical protein
MKSRIHMAAGMLATLLIAAFFTSTVLVELFGSHEAVAAVKCLIVFPGLFILVPSIALTGAMGFALSKTRGGRLVEKKKRRMPFIAMNGILVLLPSAVYLYLLSSEGRFGPAFYAVQAAELLFGATNLILMSLNIRDGLRLTGRMRHNGG